jgi:hypothetical protein
VESGVEFLGHAGATDDPAPLEDAHAQSGHRQIGGAGEAIMATTDDDRVEVRHARYYGLGEEA